MAVQKRCAQEGKIQKRDQCDAGAGDAAGGADVNGEQAMEQIERRNKIRDEDKGEKDRAG